MPTNEEQLNPFVDPEETADILLRIEKMKADLSRLNADVSDKEADTFIDEFSKWQKKSHQIAQDKGWHDAYDEITPYHIAAWVALAHSELSEALNAFRKPGQPDEHCPQFKSEEIELADVVIRLMDTCEALGINLGAAIVAKMHFNEKRDYRHGGKIV